MITEKRIQKVIREAPASGKHSLELRDHGERGAGRLTLVVRPMTGRVSAEWYAYFYRHGKRVKAKLGSYPAIPLAEARRTFLNEYAPAISSGQDPTEAKRRDASAGTVSELFEAYVDHLRRNGKRSADFAHDYLVSLKNGAARHLGSDRLAASIVPGDIVPYLAKIHGRGARVLANMARGYLSAAFNFGLKAEHDFTKADVGARWGLKLNPVAAIPADFGARRAGDRFLSPAEFRTFWLWLDGRREQRLLASATMLKMATGQRSEEILRISGAGYDRQKAIVSWEKTKNGSAHSIPLPHQAVAILDRLAPNSHGWFFPHRSKPALCARYGSVMDVIRQFLSDSPGFAPFTARDLRRTWKTLAGDAGIPKEMRDRLQNHAKGGDVSSRHYDRYDYLPERRAAMAKWAAYLDLMIAGHLDEIGAREGNVVPFDVTTGVPS
jgi:integrase